MGLLLLINSCKKDNTHNNNCKNLPIPSDTYKYPILPGTPQWVALETTEKRWEACQIPYNVLNTISTEGLIQSWIDWPFTNNLFFSNSIQKSMEYQIANFSGLNELCKRNNAGAKLFERYKLMQPSCVATMPEEEQGFFTLSFTYPEYLLAQDTILNKMNLEEKKQVVAEALKKLDEKLAHNSSFTRPSTLPSLFICAKVMKNCDYQPFVNELTNLDLLWFVNNADFYMPTGDYPSEMNIILLQSSNFIKQ